MLVLSKLERFCSSRVKDGDSYEAADSQGLLKEFEPDMKRCFSNGDFLKLSLPYLTLQF